MLQILQNMCNLQNGNTVPGPFAAVVGRAPLKVTVSEDLQRTILVPEVAELSPAEFAKLYTVSVQFHELKLIKLTYSFSKLHASQSDLHSLISSLCKAAY